MVDHAYKTIMYRNEWYKDELRPGMTERGIVGLDFLDWERDFMEGTKEKCKAALKKREDFFRQQGYFD